MLGRGALAAGLMALGAVVSATPAVHAEPVFPALASPPPPPPSAPTTRAIDPADLPPSEPSTPRALRWYGWETLLVDSAAFGAMVAGANTRSGGGALLGIGAVVYLGGGPLVHGARGHADKSAADLVIRLLAPLGAGFAGAVIGGSSPCPSTEWVCLNGVWGFAEGLLVGEGIAVAADALFLAWDRAPAPKTDTTARRGVTWSPALGVSQHGGSLGVGGAF